MEITGCEVRAIGWMMIKHLPAELLQGMCWLQSCVAMDLAPLKINLNRLYGLHIWKLYHRQHFTVGGCWNKSLHLQPLQRCYCENSGSHASACATKRHYSITYTQSLHTINGLLAVVRVGNLLCGRHSYKVNVMKGWECVIIVIRWKWKYTFILCSRNTFNKTHDRISLFVLRIYTCVSVCLLWTVSYTILIATV